MDFCDDVKRTILEFLDDLRDNVFENDAGAKGDIMLVEMFFKRMHEERVMNHVISKILPHNEKIRNRDLSYFETNMDIFAGLPEENLKKYSRVITKDLNDDDINIIWEYMETILILAEDYRKYK